MNKQVLIMYVKISLILISVWAVFYSVSRFHGNQHTHKDRISNTDKTSPIQTEQIKNNHSEIELSKKDLDNIRETVKEKDLLCLEHQCSKKQS